MTFQPTPLEAVALFTIVLAIGLGAMSPGPSFVMVARTALAATPAHGRLAALGIGAASLIFSVAAVTGLGVVFLAAEWLFVAVKVAGGAFLVYLGIQMWRSRGSHAEIEAERTGGGSRTFLTALLTQMSNPKAIVVYASVFASALPTNPSLWLMVAIPVCVAAVETLWYLIVATVLSRQSAQQTYRRWSRAIDRTAGSILGGLGACLSVDGVRTALR